MKYYLEALLAMAGITTAAAAHFGPEKTLEPGYYPGKIDRQQAVLHVVYRSWNIRDCYLTIRTSEGNRESETIEDALCNEKNLSLDKKGQNSATPREDNLKNKIKENPEKQLSPP